jgi:hypothetical protein
VSEGLLPDIASRALLYTMISLISQQFSLKSAIPIQQNYLHLHHFRVVHHFLNVGSSSTTTHHLLGPIPIEIRRYELYFSSTLLYLHSGNVGIAHQIIKSTRLHHLLSHVHQLRVVEQRTKIGHTTSTTGTTKVGQTTSTSTSRRFSRTLNATSVSLGLGSS